MKNYSILAAYKRQYIDKYKDQPEPVIAESSYGDSIEMDIYLPYKDKFEPFRVKYSNTDCMELLYMDETAEYTYKAYYKESQKVQEVNLYNLLACASNLMLRHKTAERFESAYKELTPEKFKDIQVENYDEVIAVRYCKEGYNPQAINDCYRLLSFCESNYFGKETWRTEVDSYAAKHVFEELLSKLSSTTYVHTSEFTAAAVMFYSYILKLDKLNLKADPPNWEMSLPDYYEVLSYIRGLR